MMDFFDRLLGQEAVDDDSDLRAGGVALRVMLRADAGDVALADGPLHGGGGVGADIGTVGEAGQRAGCRGRAHVAVQDGRDLLTGDGRVGAERRSARAGDNRVLVCPEHGVGVVIGLRVLERIRHDPLPRGRLCEGAKV